MTEQKIVLEEPTEDEQKQEWVDYEDKQVTIDDREETQNPVVEQAKQRGHISKEEWVKSGRDPEKWKSPEEFNEFGKSYEVLKPHLEMLKKEIAKRDTALDAMVNHIKEVKEKEYIRGKLEVEQKLAEAEAIGDVQAVKKLTMDKFRLDQESQQEQQKKIVEESSRVEAMFKERNKHWYNEQHPNLIIEAQNEAIRQQQLYPTASLAEIANRVEQEMTFRHYDLVNRGVSRTPITTPSESSISKAEYTAKTGDSDERVLKNMSSRDRSEYLSIKQMVEKVPGIKYTVKEYLQKQQEYKARRGEE